ncbi:MAG: ABC transporter permease [Bacillota bacterium]|nr:ABC transporter permease [Bacillota bacterium]HOK71104.1 ABC transporter permease [Bacillota bacterium]HOL51005.1 ABC transporter permease [Bacillota bacterium]HOO29939.1 ABC transporter permease [Bacillota bacterium]HPQ01789.1 ABC transporter permease [Bacillota bacterium]
MEYSAEMFKPINKDIDSAEAIVRPSVTYWQDAWRRLKKNRMAMVGLWTIVAILVIAIFGPMVSPYSYSDQNLEEQNQYCSSKHWLGTDDLGRDLLTRIMYGARISLTVGFLASLLNLTVGVIYGGISGFYGGKIDNIMMRIVEVLNAIPMLLYVILLMVILEPGLQNILIALGLVYWLGMARIVRGQVLSLKEQDYVLAARSIGASNWQIITKHLIPNAMGPIIVTATLNIPSAIFTEAFLSFIGLGVNAPMASWGVLASDALQSFRSYPWQLFFPAIAISITMFAFNFLGDGLRDALDPKQRK